MIYRQGLGAYVKIRERLYLQATNKTYLKFKIWKWKIIFFTMVSLQYEIPGEQVNVIYKILYFL